MTAGTAAELRDADARDRTRDHEALDLRRALEDRVDLRVPVPLLHRVLTHVAVAAEDLNRLLGDPHRDLTGLELAHRALTGGELLAVVAHPARAVHEEPGRVDLHLHVGELERDALVLDDRPAERLALLGVLERVLVGGPGDAERLRAHQRPAGLERAHRRLHPARLALLRTGDAGVELLLP